MKAKQNLVLLIILVIFATVVIIVERPFENKAKKVEEEALPLFPELQADKVKKLEIKKSDKSTITLKNKDSVWYVVDKEEYPADPQAVDESIKKLQGLKKLNVVSTKKDKHGLFEVKEGMGMEVSAFGPEDKKVADLLIGKNGPDLFSTYIRRAESDEVFLVGEYLKGPFEREVNNWRDKRMFEFNADAVSELTIAHKDEVIAMSKDTKGEWQLEKPVSGIGDKDKVQEVLRTLSALRASDFADEAATKDSGLGTPEYQISVKLADGSKKTLSVGNKKDEQFFFAKSDGKNYVYLLHKSLMEKLTPTVKDLEKAKAAPEEGQESQSPAAQKLPELPSGGVTPGR